MPSRNFGTNPIFLIPGGLRRQMIQDEILLERIDRTTFMATGRGI